ncbi:N utilization substance protein B [Alphaproteobacteria bacterium]|nr:N utilization substance protein B [Alphaproteobacteria bacterium]
MQSKNERKSKTGLRGMSRLCAVQVAYKAGLCGQKMSVLANDPASLEIFISENISSSEMDNAFFKSLLDMMEENIAFIDGVIEKHLSESWKLERIDSVIKCILRLAIAELMCFKEIPINVVLNEYIEITKAFFDVSEVAFVNGLLNVASKELRELK